MNKLTIITTSTYKAIINMLLLSFSFVVVGQSNQNHSEDPNVSIFMTYLHNHWADIHDVIMRFHYDDPELKGIVLIQMNWQKGTLLSATIDSNSTANEYFGSAIIEAIKKWSISGLADSWSITLPIKTEIVGNRDPEFLRSGILTGKILDTNGGTIPGVKVTLSCVDSINHEPILNFTNSEGIFIQTLIPAGNWQLSCAKNGYLPVIIDELTLDMGEHIKKTIVMKN